MCTKPEAKVGKVSNGSYRDFVNFVAKNSTLDGVITQSEPDMVSSIPQSENLPTEDDVEI